MALFKENLEVFARKHKRDINRNPQFRRQFARMCEKIGVDPLASSKGFWAELLGVGDFYYELSVQIIHVCLSTRKENGGLIAIDDLLRRLQVQRGAQSQAITSDDVRRAVEKVKVLGRGFSIVTIGHRKMILSVPIEFNRDHTEILALAQTRGFTNFDEIHGQTGWPDHRISSALNLVLQEGMAWIDMQTSREKPDYWFPSLVVKQSQENSPS